LEGEIVLKYEFVNEFPHEILKEKEGPLISIYQPTHRHRPENNQDPIRFKNLIQRIENEIKDKYSDIDLDKFMKPFYELLENKVFWNDRLDGLAILANKNKMVIYNLQRTVSELAIVSDNFHIKPLIRVFQSADRYHLLGLNREEFKLFEGNRYGFEEVELEEGIPNTIEEVLGREYTEAHLSQGSYGGASGTQMFHGHGGRKDEIDKDTPRFFRNVDKIVWENYSRDSKLPLILVTLPEHQTEFRKVSKNPNLVDAELRVDYESLDMEELREKAWEVIEPYYLEKTRKLVERFKEAQAQFLGSDDVAQVAKAIIENRVDTILIESDKQISGNLNRKNGDLIIGIKDERQDDILGDLAEMAIQNGGNIVVLPKDRMPTGTGVAAMYRF
jgi:release factor family 3